MQHVQNPDGTYSQQVKLKDSDVQLPVDIQSRFTNTIRTQNAVNVGASGSAVSAFVDCDGFVNLSASLVNNAATTSSLNIEWSHDGTAIHGEETVIATGTTAIRAPATVEVRARWARVKVVNGDASAHVMSTWVYLKT